MVHTSQKIRMENQQIVKQLIAATMPRGAKDRYLVAMCCTTYGFHRRTMREYLEDLKDAGRIIWDIQAEVWKLPTVEGAKKK